jgi:hypothetical protein
VIVIVVIICKKFPECDCSNFEFGSLNFECELISLASVDDGFIFVFLEFVLGEGELFVVLVVGG